MSTKNTFNNTNQQHRKQPIHFYASSKGSLDDVRNGYCPINFMTSPLSYVSSPSKYDLQKMSPVRGNKAMTFIRSPEQEIKVDRVLNSSISSKYAKLSYKIQLLQKNLNRLNGQHESLKHMFLKSQQLSKCFQVYSFLEKLKVKIQQSKTNKYIQQKRYDARLQIVHEDYMKKFGQFKKQLLNPQFQQIKILQNDLQKSKDNKELTKFYSDSFKMAQKNIMLIDENATKFLNEVQENLKKQSLEFLNKKAIEDMITQEKYKINQKVKNVKIKLGELKNVTEYEMHLERKHFQGKNHPQLNNSNSKKEKSIQQTMNQRKQQQKYVKEQAYFVGLQSLDRLTYQLSTTDSNLVRILEQYQDDKRNNEKSSSNKIEPKFYYEFQISLIHEQISHLKDELAGLKSYMKSSERKIQRMKQKQYINQNGKRSFNVQNIEILQSIIDLEEKINLLQENLNFFRTNCL